MFHLEDCWIGKRLEERNGSSDDDDWVIFLQIFFFKIKNLSVAFPIHSHLRKMSKITRSSKFRHTVAALGKREEWYTDLRPSTSTSDADTAAASSRFVGVVWENGNSVAVLPIDGVGKRLKEPIKIHAHSSQIYDIQFSSLSDNLLSTCAEDGSVKVFSLPDQLTADISNAEAVLQGHKRRTNAIRFHPSADGLLASASNDKTVKIWNIETAQGVLSLETTSPGNGLSWNFDGSMLGFSGEKVVAVLDPRANAVVQAGEGHLGVKASRLSWLGSSSFFATTGFGRSRERQVKPTTNFLILSFNLSSLLSFFFGIQLCLWDSRKLSSAVSNFNLDSSTGIIQPFFDSDTNLLFLAGKVCLPSFLFVRNYSHFLYTHPSHTHTHTLLHCRETETSDSMSFLRTRFLNFPRFPMMLPLKQLVWFQNVLWK